MSVSTKIFNVSDLKPMPKNVKKHPSWQIEKIVNSISTYCKEPKILQPIVVDENTMILIGHGRYQAIKELNWKQIECYVKEGLNEDEKKALAILDNKTVSLEWDEDLLAKVLPDLSDKALETGFTEKELHDIVARASTVDIEIEPVYDMSPRLYEKYNYILLFFKNEIDYLYASQLFQLKKMKDRMKPTKVGLYRAVDGMKAIKSIKEKPVHEISSPEQTEVKTSEAGS